MYAFFCFRLCLMKESNKNKKKSIWKDASQNLKGTSIPPKTDVLSLDERTRVEWGTFPNENSKYLSNVNIQERFGRSHCKSMSTRKTYPCVASICSPLFSPSSHPSLVFSLFLIYLMCCRMKQFQLLFEMEKKDVRVSERARTRMCAENCPLSCIGIGCIHARTNTFFRSHAG